MSWVFWILLIVGLLLLISPLLGIVEVALSATLWIIGGLLLIGAIIWAVATLSRGVTRTAPPAA